MGKVSSAATWHGFVVVFFLIQQIIAFVLVPFTFVSIYWIAVTLFTVFLFFKVRFKIDKTNQRPFVFVVLCSLGALANTITGSPIGNGVSICFYSFLAFVGLSYVTKYRINTSWFVMLFVLMYLFFYFRYFIYDELTRLSMDDDLFGKASSNAIPMSLNMMLIIYWMISQRQSENHRWIYMCVSLINLWLIIIQGSRAGILVAFILAVLSILHFWGLERKLKIRFRLLVPIVLIVFLAIEYQDFLFGFLAENKMEGVESFEEDVRFFAQWSFFSNMNIVHFIIGYPTGYEFVPEITRTFNAFLDLWSRCGFPAFLFLVYCLFVRIKEHSNFDVPLYLLLPFFAYAPFESLWGGTLWDICLFICLFYSHKEDIYINRNSTTI